MSNRKHSFNLWTKLLAAPLLLASTAISPEMPNGDSSFQGNRRPGILGPATEEPTGENAEIFRRLGTFSATEMLDLVSEPVPEARED